MQKFHYGFSLIELMIVVAIIGILSVIAIPSYQSYTQRARFAEVITTAENFKIAIALALQEGIPADELFNGVHGIPIEPSPTNHLANLTVKNGIITATATKIAGNATLILTPNSDGNIWSVSGTCVDTGLCQS
jgi:prepilin-type N-terminal cleavage/methylation domain-containing protein